MSRLTIRGARGRRRTDPGNPALGRYELCHRRADGGRWTCWGVNGTFSTIFRLTNGVAYEVRVEAVNSEGAGPATSRTGTPGP